MVCLLVCSLAHVYTSTNCSSQNGMNFFFTYYIPIYFQSIDNYSAARSGIYNLPLIFGACESLTHNL